MTNTNNIQWRKILLHTIVWIIVLSMPYLLRYSPSNRPKDPDEKGFFLLSLLTSFFWIPLFYFNYYVLTPRFIYRRKFSQYALIVLGAYLVIILVHSWMFVRFIYTHQFHFFNGTWFNFFPFLLSLAVSTSIRQAEDKTRSDTLLLQRQEENLKTELSFLRSQISPHFMFNVLNNMLAMARLRSDQLEPTIIKLSSLMRYILYEADEEKVSLKKEVDYLQSYIDLQRQRIGNKVALKVNMQIGEDEYTIAPMLLIPFIENAFKHSTAAIDKPAIEIELYISHNMLYFRVANTYNKETIEIKDKTSGIGLQNVKRRLNLLYGDRYSLLINEIDNWFTVSLQLNLQS
jgi:sensor histidine kinase YesM